MAYNEDLAHRVREALADRNGVTEKKMFGGLSFMMGGNMACGILKDDLVVRVGPDSHEKALANRHARPMDFTGRGLGHVGEDVGGESGPGDPGNDVGDVRQCTYPSG